MSATGKWVDPLTPKRNWQWEDVEDLGEPSDICEMCEVQEIRYVHIMWHQNYPRTLRVGCHCAAHMSGDTDAANTQERVARRMRSWLKRKWRRSRSGGTYLRADGRLYILHPTEAGFVVYVKVQRWSLDLGLHMVTLARSRPRPTEQEAKLALLKWLEKERRK
jgi:hypothetical protein